MVFCRVGLQHALSYCSVFCSEGKEEGRCVGVKGRPLRGKEKQFTGYKRKRRKDY